MRMKSCFPYKVRKTGKAPRISQMEHSRRYSSKRVVDYFIVVGAAHNELQRIEEDSSGNEFEKGPPSLRSPFHPFVTDRYPQEDRPDEELPEGIQLFCLPNGVQLVEAPRRPTLHSFVHTNPMGEHLQGCCLTFYELITAGQRASIVAMLSPGTAIPEHLYAPRCLCLVSHSCFPASFKKVLCGLYHQHFLQSAIPIERYICNLIDDVPAPSAARVDVTFYFGEQPVTFKCPPANEPQVGFPSLWCLFPTLWWFSLILQNPQH